MGIGMMRRHYANESDSSRVVIEPQFGDPDAPGGVVAIGDEPGTAPTPLVADADERNLEDAPASEDAPNVAGANEQAASADQFGDAEHSVDPEGHPVDAEAVTENLEADPTTDEAGNSLGGPETAPEAPARGATKSVWVTFYTDVLGQDPGDRTRDELANDYLGPKPE